MGEGKRYSSVTEQMLEEGADAGIANPIVLRKPILINGETRKTLSWDADDLDTERYIEAANHAMDTYKATVSEADYRMHLYLGFALIITANPDIDFVDLENGVKSLDIMKVVNLGRFFITRSDGSEPETSEAPSGPTPAPTTPPSSTSSDSPSGDSSSSSQRRERRS